MHDFRSALSCSVVNETIPKSGSTPLFLRDPIIRTVITDGSVAGGLKNISAQSVLVSEVAVVDAAAERIAGIVLAVRPTPLPRSQPYSVAPRTQFLEVEKVVSDHISMRSLVPHRAPLPTVALHTYPSVTHLKKSVPDNRVGGRTVNSHHLPA